MPRLGVRPIWPSRISGLRLVFFDPVLVLRSNRTSVVSWLEAFGGVLRGRRAAEVCL